MRRIRSGGRLDSGAAADGGSRLASGRLDAPSVALDASRVGNGRGGCRVLKSALRREPIEDRSASRGEGSALAAVIGALDDDPREVVVRAPKIVVVKLLGIRVQRI